MTLVAALTGLEGAAMFADTQETIYGYSKKTVDKLCVFDLPNRPFRFAIAGATTDANYVDMLQAELVDVLNVQTGYDARQITKALTEKLLEFYPKHVWQRPESRPQMEYLITLQPLPHGEPKIIHIAETAANVITGWHKSIGIGCYLADYLFNSVLGGGEPLTQLANASVYVAQETSDNVDGVGPIDRVVLFGDDGSYDELRRSEIESLEVNLKQMHEITSTSFAAITCCQNKDDHDMWQDHLSNTLRELYEENTKIFDKWVRGRDNRKRYLQFRAKRQLRAHSASGGDGGSAS